MPEVSPLDLVEEVREAGQSRTDGEAGTVSVRQGADGVALTVTVPNAAFEGGTLGVIAASLSTLLRTRAVALLDPWSMRVTDLRALVKQLCRQRGRSVVYEARGTSPLLVIAASGDESEVFLLAPADAVDFDPVAAVRRAVPQAALANLLPASRPAVHRVIATGPLRGVPDPLTGGAFRQALLTAGVQADDLLDPWLAQLREQAKRNQSLQEELAGRELAMRRVERELAEARARIQRDERSLVVDRFAGYFRHKIKNPLAALMADSRLITGRSRDDWDADFLPKLERAAGRIGGAAERITAMIDGLDRSGGGFDARLTPATGAEIVALVQRAAELATMPVSVVEPDRATGAVGLRINDAALEDVFEELFANAAHYPAEGRRLRASVEFALEGDPLRWTCRVRDTGRGVPADARPRIFDYTFTTRVDGTGKGLALCRQYVEDLGGSIAEEGSADGAVFVVRLPLVHMEGAGS